MCILWRSLRSLVVVRAAFLACAFAVAAHAASFDCAKAGTRVEKAICADPALGRLDEEIAAAWRAAGADLDEPMRQRLVRSQREWLKGRRPPPDLAPALRQRLAQLRATRVTLSDVDLLRLAGDSRPMYVLGTAPGAAAYNQWVDGVWKADADDTSPRDADAAQEKCIAQAPAGQQGDCMEESETHAYETIVPAPGIVSVTERVVIDQHAAHPIDEVHHHHWWLSRSGRITVADVFVGNGYRAVIAKAVKRFVQRDGGTASQAAIDEVSDPDAWSIGADALTLTGDGYTFEHGRGKLEIVVPWREFGGALRAEFGAALRQR